MHAFLGAAYMALFNPLPPTCKGSKSGRERKIPGLLWLLGPLFDLDPGTNHPLNPPPPGPWGHVDIPMSSYSTCPTGLQPKEILTAAASKPLSSPA